MQRYLSHSDTHVLSQPNDRLFSQLCHETEFLLPTQTHSYCLYDLSAGSELHRASYPIAIVTGSLLGAGFPRVFEADCVLRLVLSLKTFPLLGKHM